MPRDLVLVRHGESEGNKTVQAAKNGDNSGYTEQYMTTPGSQWRLTDKGRAQLATTGAWIAATMFTDTEPRPDTCLFDRCMVSPYVRARESAAHLNLPHARWYINRALRERDWGDIGSIPRSEFESHPWWRQNAQLKHIDPLYWCAPNGESIAQVAEDRIRNVLDTMHREWSGQRVVAVCHGETMSAFKLVLERMSDEQFLAWEKDPNEKIDNGEAFHYTRQDPHDATAPLASRLTWMRSAKPVLLDNTWRMRVSTWRHINFESYSNSDLLAQVQQVPSLFKVDA